MDTITLTGIVTKAHLARTKSEGENKYVTDGSFSLYEVLNGVIPDNVDKQNILLVFKKNRAPRLLKKNALIHIQGEFIAFKKKLAFSVNDINFLSPTATRQVLEKRGINLDVERKLLAENNQFAVNDAIQSGRLSRLENLYSQDVQALDKMLEKGSFHTDVETPYHIVDFFEHRAHARGFDAVTEMVIKNPYVLAEVDGMGYDKAEMFAKGMQWEHPDSHTFRLYAQLTAATWSYARTGGHSYIPLAHAKVRLNKELIQQLGGRTNREEKFLLANLSGDIQKKGNIAAAHLITSGTGEWPQEVGCYYNERYKSLVPSEKLNYYGTMAGTGFYLARSYFAERYGAELFADRCGQEIWETGLTELNSSAIQSKLDADQLEALKNAVTSRMSVIVGPAGSGKTHTTAELLRILQSIGKKTCVLAPSAMAASIAANKTGISDVNFQTIHRFARILTYAEDLGTNESAIASGGREDLQDFQSIIIDEMSMCDMPTFYAFLYAFKENQSAHIVLVGDIAQLPAIGPSGFFHQLVRGVLGEKVPVVTLKGNYRSGDSLIDFARTIREGKYIAPREDTTISLINESLQSILETVQKYREEGYGILDILVLTTRRNNPLGTQNLNIALRSLFLPNAQQISRSTFFVGDPVIAVKNDYGDREMSLRQKNMRHPDRNTNIYNGTRGIITEYDEKSSSVKIKFKNITEENEVWYKIDELPFWVEPAYALTVHKAQGSEAPCVIFTRSRPGEKVSRNMIYTAITRAKKSLRLIEADWQNSIEKELPDPYSKFAFRVMTHWDKKSLTERIINVKTADNVDLVFR